jgi:putative chitinase
VARGDTLGAIARRYGTTVSALQRANSIRRASQIRIGQVLQVGIGGSWSPLVWKRPAVVVASNDPQDGAREHIVRPGETLYQIARRYGLTIAALAAANDISSPNRIVVGTALAIPGGSQAR